MVRLSPGLLFALRPGKLRQKPGVGGQQFIGQTGRGLERIHRAIENKRLDELVAAAIESRFDYGFHPREPRRKSPDDPCRQRRLRYRAQPGTLCNRRAFHNRLPGRLGTWPRFGRFAE